MVRYNEVLSMYLERFNNGYYVTKLYIEPTKKGEACINEESYRDLQYELYPEGELKEGKDIVVSIEDRHFKLTPARNTPTGVLSIPQSDIEEMSIQNAPKPYPILVAEPWFKDYLSWTKA